jgi:hypothetical protein
MWDVVLIECAVRVVKGIAANDAFESIDVEPSSAPRLHRATDSVGGPFACV